LSLLLHTSLKMDHFLRNWLPIFALSWYRSKSTTITCFVLRNELKICSTPLCTYNIPEQWSHKSRLCCDIPEQWSTDLDFVMTFPDQWSADVNFVMVSINCSSVTSVFHKVRRSSTHFKSDDH
jgi:hypothetical protein